MKVLVEPLETALIKLAQVHGGSFSVAICFTVDLNYTCYDLFSDIARTWPAC